MDSNISRNRLSSVPLPEKLDELYYIEFSGKEKKN